MKIIGRNYKLKELKSCLEAKMPKFIAVYERRIRKTHLIKIFLIINLALCK